MHTYQQEPPANGQGWGDGQVDELGVPRRHRPAHRQDVRPGDGEIVDGIVHVHGGRATPPANLGPGGGDHVPLQLGTGGRAPADRRVDRVTRTIRPRSGSGATGWAAWTTLARTRKTAGPTGGSTTATKVEIAPYQQPGLRIEALVWRSGASGATTAARRNCGSGAGARAGSSLPWKPASADDCGVTYGYEQATGRLHAVQGDDQPLVTYG